MSRNLAFGWTGDGGGSNAATMAAQFDDDTRPGSAKVYPAVKEADGWVVEAPVYAAASDELRTFTGPTALSQALEYAHHTYGAALCFLG